MEFTVTVTVVPAWPDALDPVAGETESHAPPVTVVAAAAQESVPPVALTANVWLVAPVEVNARETGATDSAAVAGCTMRMRLFWKSVR